MGDALADIDTVSYFVYTTDENNGRYAENLPSVAMEVDPTGPNESTGRNYSTLVYVPVQQPSNAWTKQDATTAQR